MKQQQANDREPLAHDPDGEQARQPELAVIAAAAGAPPRPPPALEGGADRQPAAAPPADAGAGALADADVDDTGDGAGDGSPAGVVSFVSLFQDLGAHRKNGSAERGGRRRRGAGRSFFWTFTVLMLNC